MPRHFANWLKAYVDHTSASEAPDIFHFWTGVVTVGGALRRKVWKDELIFQWVPNFYVILVAPPGVATKSTSIGLGMRLLRQVDGIHFGPESMTWQALGESLSTAEEYFDYVDPDTGTTMTQKMSCLTISISELGTFLRTDDSQLISFLTRMWDGQKEPFKHKTKSSGEIDVDNPWLNVIGATTPSWMRNNFGENLVGEGLTSRVVFVYAEEKRHFVAYPSKLVKGADYAETERKLVEDLKDIATMSGPILLAPDAEVWGVEWYRKHYQERSAHLSSDRFGGYIARKQTHLHKLAMVLAASKRSKLIIEKEDLIEADAILTDTEKSMLKVFESVGLVDEARHVASLQAFVRGYGFLQAQELRNMTLNTMTEKDFKQALRIAVEGGLLVIAEKEGKRGLALAKRTVN
jgi:hypothetical protein